jgi:hypothetical protein
VAAGGFIDGLDSPQPVIVIPACRFKEGENKAAVAGAQRRQSIVVLAIIAFRHVAQKFETASVSPWPDFNFPNPRIRLSAPDNQLMKAVSECEYLGPELVVVKRAISAPTEVLIIEALPGPLRALRSPHCERRRRRDLDAPRN